MQKQCSHAFSPELAAPLLAVHFGGRPVFQSVDGKVAEVDGQFGFADEADALYECHLLEEDGGVLYQVARLPHLEKGARVNPDFTLEQPLALLPGTDFENVHVPSGAPVHAVVLELVVPRGDGDLWRLLFLGLHLGRQIPRDDLLVDDSIAFELGAFVPDETERRDAPQGVQTTVLLQLGKRGVNLHIHRRAAHRLRLSLRNSAVIFNNRIRRHRQWCGDDTQTENGGTQEEADLQ